ncbi:hypothetical protein R3P38DRAFT_3091355 [Favolaschia claudopus]|uniref:F-box domain-containing protein n=1 Tax=Favolaschia claudopus TaxID=2862362 RepID=A0AAV9ZT12_9AGAR
MSRRLLHSLCRTQSKPRQLSFSVCLPTEIHFSIIDHFEGDILRLRRLCLICRAWASHAQLLLFREISLRHDNYERFLALLSTRHYLGRSVLCLHVSSWRLWNEPKLRILDSITLTTSLPNLQALDLAHIALAPDDIAIESGGPQWRFISELQIRFSKFTTSEAMIAFLALFPRLENLEVTQCRIDNLASTGPRSAPLAHRIVLPDWHLKHLALGEFPPTPLVDWLVQEPAELRVDHLRILSVGTDASALNGLLCKIGGQLKHLELPELTSRGRGQQVALSIKPCVVLSTLTFSERSSYDRGHGIIHTLLDIASPSMLRTVSFDIHLDAGYRDTLWEAIENVLIADGAFSALETVEFGMSGIADGRSSFNKLLTAGEHAVFLMKERLPILEAKGLLQFHFESAPTNAEEVNDGRVISDDTQRPSMWPRQIWSRMLWKKEHPPFSTL